MHMVVTPQQKTTVCAKPSLYRKTNIAPETYT